MFDNLKRILRFSNPRRTACSQPPGVPFPWPAGVQIEATEDTVLAIPAAVLFPNEKIGEVIHVNADAEIRLPVSPSDTLIRVRLRKGMVIGLSKPVQGVVVSEDNRPRRLILIQE